MSDYVYPEVMVVRISEDAFASTARSAAEAAKTAAETAAATAASAKTDAETAATTATSASTAATTARTAAETARDAAQTAQAAAEAAQAAAEAVVVDAVTEEDLTTALSSKADASALTTLEGTVAGKADASALTTGLAAKLDASHAAIKALVEAATGEDRIDASAIKNLPEGTGVTDGDKGDIEVASSGTAWTLKNEAVTNEKVAAGIAQSKIANLTTDLAAKETPAGAQAKADAAQAAAEATAAAALTAGLANKVDVVSGKQLSTEDYTTAEKTKLASITPGEGGGDGSSLRETIDQTAHGLEALQPVYHDGTEWVGAQANDLTTARPIGIIESVPDANSFVLVKSGRIEHASIEAGLNYFLSAAASALVTTQPSGSGIYVTFCMTGISTGVGEVSIQLPVSGLIGPDELDMDAVAAALPGLTLPEEASDSDMVAGDETSPRLMSPADVKLAVQTHTPEISLPQDNYSATTAPGPGNDTTQGYSAGSDWYDQVGLKLYRCVNAAEGGAVWVLISGTADADVTAPNLSLVSITAEGDVLHLDFDEPVKFGAGGDGGLALTPSGAAVTATYLAGEGTSRLIYTLSRPIASSETVTAIYTQPTDGIEDLAGNDFITTDYGEVDNYSTYSPSSSVSEFGFTPDSEWTDTGSALASPSFVAVKVTGISAEQLQEIRVRALNVESSSREYALYLYDHDAANDRPGARLEKLVRTYNPSSAGVYTDLAHPGTADLTGVTTAWVVLALENANSRFAHVAVAEGTQRAIIVATTTTEFATVSSATTHNWDSLANFATGTVYTDRRYCALIETVVAGDSTAPTVSSATIDATGEQLTLVFDEDVQIGSGGNAGLTLSASGGPVTATYAAGSGTNSLIYTLSRIVTEEETVTRTYTNPGDGIEDLAGNDLEDFAAQAVDNQSAQAGGGGGITYLISDDLEYADNAAAAAAGWVANGSGGSFGYVTSPAPLQGSYSYRSNSNTNWHYRAFTAQSEVWAYALWNVPDLASTRVALRLDDNAGVEICRLEVTSGGGPRVVCGAVTQTAGAGGTIVVGTTYHVWLRYVKGTGADAIVEAYVSTDGTKPGSPSSTPISNGAATADAARIVLRASGTVAAVWDKIRVAASSIGSNPT